MLSLTKRPDIGYENCKRNAKHKIPYIMIDNILVKRAFADHFPGRCDIYAAPGRINLIGEHTDYNGGFVFPGAVDFGITVAIRANGTDRARAFSMDFGEMTEFGLREEDLPEKPWARYIFGVCREMQKLGVEVQGFDCAFAGDVPLGAGMSSSAALESAFAYALNEMFADGRIDKFELARAGQMSEHHYVGVNCGIMDQFASVFGKKGNLMRLDCRSMEFQYFPFDPHGYRLMLVNSVVKHELVGSPYNQRRASCERVAAALGVETLRDAGMPDLEAIKERISEEDYRRAAYVIGEKQRVLTVCDALLHDDYEKVGECMYRTHEGLSREYEVSCEELDFLVEIARECGVSGSRIMGGGFGGCTINLVKNELYDGFVQRAVKEFAAKYGHEPKIYGITISDGARRLE